MTAFEAPSMLIMNGDPAAPKAAPARSEAYNLKLFSAYVLNISAYTIPAKKKGIIKRKK